MIVLVLVFFVCLFVCLCFAALLSVVDGSPLSRYVVLSRTTKEAGKSSLVVVSVDSILFQIHFPFLRGSQLICGFPFHMKGSAGVVPPINEMNGFVSRDTAIFFAEGGVT